MSHYVLYEDSGFANLLPALYWRTVFEIRCGRTNLAERMQRLIGAAPAGLWTRTWIAEIAAERFDVPINQRVSANTVLVNGRWSPDGPVQFPSTPTVGVCDGDIAFLVCDAQLAERFGPEHFLDPEERAELLAAAPKSEVPGTIIRYPWDIVTRNAHLLGRDRGPTPGAIEGDVHAAAVLLQPDAVHVARGARVMPGAVLDATGGPIELQADAVVQPHAVIHGPAHIGRGSVINPHAFIHGGTTIGPVCKIGGEVDACVFQGYSNKQHDGFLGHCYVGSWVNLGAGTVNSDLKNTYGAVRVPINGEPIDTGQMFVGAVIGDHVKTGIHTTLPTGAVIGFGATVAYSRLLPQFVGSFTWLTDRGFEEGDTKRLVETARKTMARRDIALTGAESALFEKLQQVAAYFEPAIAAQRHSIKATTAVPQQASLAQPE